MRFFIFLNFFLSNFRTFKQANILRVFRIFIGVWELKKFYVNNIEFFLCADMSLHQGTITG